MSDDSKRFGLAQALFLKIKNILPKAKNLLLTIFGQAKKDKLAEKKIDHLTPEQQPPRLFPTWRQIKYLPKFLSKKEKIIFWSAVMAIIICLCLIAYLFIKDNLVLKPAAGGTYTENIVGSPQYINPLYSSANEVDRDLVALTFAGLIRFDENQNIAPDLAKEWFVDETKTKYTFVLRDDIYWPDEKQFTAEDVVFTFEAIKNPKYQSPQRSNWSGVALAALDDFTVQFTLPEPFNPFLYNLNLGILPAHWWQDILPENARLAELNSKPVGLGPYQFNSLSKDKQGFIKSYTLVKNKNYHLGAPFIDEITLKFYPSFEIAVDSLKNKNADGLNFLPQNLKELIIPRKDLVYYSLDLPQYTAVFFNQEKNPILKSKVVRQALELSLNKVKIIADVLDNQGQIINSPILPAFPGYDNSTSTYDVDMAKAMLEDAGWKQKEIEVEVDNTNNTSTEEIIEPIVETVLSDYLYKDDEELRLKLTIADRPLSVATAELIQKFWQAIGVNVELDIREAGSIQNEIINPREFEALLFGEILGRDPDPYAFWHSSQADGKGLNLADFKNNQVDKILEEARKKELPEDKADDYKEFSKIISQEIPAIFLYSPKYIYPVSNRIKGINLIRIISPADRLNGITHWYIKTKKGWK